MIKKLKVNLLDEEIGVLTEDEYGRLNFEYLESWLNNPNAYSISNQLKLERRIFEDFECKAFFSGLLPEDLIRTKIAAKLKISEENHFSLLEVLGGDCAGAISLASFPKKKNISIYQSKIIATKDLKRTLLNLDDNPLLISEGIRLSLAGAQNKIALLKKNNKFYIPGSKEITTHIIKPNIAKLNNTVFNEFACMSLAKLCGIEVPQVEIALAEEHPYLIIERFDRTKFSNGKLKRVHQEDFCQALGILSERKYQKEGGPSLSNCAKLIDQVSSKPGLDKMKFLEIVIFNFLIANNDAHGKNFSLRLGTKSIRLTPFYDLLSTEIYPKLNQEMAMKFGKQYLASKINKHDLIQLSEDLSIKAQLIQSKIIDLKNIIEKNFPKLYEHSELKSHSDLLDQIFRLISKRSNLLAKLL